MVLLLGGAVDLLAFFFEEKEEDAVRVFVLDLEGERVRVFFLFTD